MDLAAPTREALPAPRRPLPGEPTEEYELAVLAYLRQAVPRVPQFARCTALMGRELPDAAQFAKVAFWADAVVDLMPAQDRPAALDRAFVLHLAFDVFGRAWKACKWAQLQTTGAAEKSDRGARAVSRDARRRSAAPYDRSRRGHTTSNVDTDILAGAMQSMTLDATTVLKGALEAAAALGDVDVDALCATFAAASLNPSPPPVASPSFPNPTAAPDNVKPKRSKPKRKTRPRHDPWEAQRALLRLVESRKRFFGSDARWGPPRRSRVGLDSFADCIP